MLRCLMLCLLLQGYLTLGAQSQADQYIQEQDYVAALEVLQADDTNSDQQKMAYCLYQLGRWPEAKAVYDTLLVRDSLHEEAHRYLARIYSQEWNLPKAILHTRMLTDLDTLNPVPYKSLGDLYAQAQLPVEAWQQYQKALQLNPKDVTVWMKLTDLSLQNRQFDLADSLLNQAFQLDTNNVRLYLLRSRVSYGLKEYPGVISALECAARYLDIDPFYQKMLGYAYMQCDSLDQAIHTLLNLLYEEQSEFTYAYLAKAYASKGLPDEALYHYQKAADAGLSNQLGDYYVGKARILQDQNDLRKAMQEYEQAFLFGGGPACLLEKARLCELYYKDKSMAMRQYQRFLDAATAETDGREFAQQRIRLIKEYLHQSR